MSVAREIGSGRKRLKSKFPKVNKKKWPFKTKNPETPLKGECNDRARGFCHNIPHIP
jgi:hypothetical protein